MTVVSISARRRAPRVALVLLAVLALLAALALIPGAEPAVALLALLLALLLTLAGAATLLPRRTPPRRRAAAPARPGPAPRQIAVALEDGALHQVLVVPVEQSDGRRLVLTAAGYLLLDAEGRVIYRL